MTLEANSEISFTGGGGGGGGGDADLKWEGPNQGALLTKQLA